MTTTRYLWNPINQNIIREYDGAGSTVASYTTEPDLYGDVISQHRDGQDSYYHTDGQGSTLALTDSSGDVTDSYAYSGFGEVTAQAGGTANSFQYIGQKGYYRDAETGEYDVRRRQLDAISARWLCVDPLVVADHSASLITGNLYSYALNNSINELDPSGLQVAKTGAYRACLAGCDTTFPRWYQWGARSQCKDACGQTARTIGGVPVMSMPFGYGHYCGPTRKATCATTGSFTGFPIPWDELDAACAEHDCCLFTPCDFFNYFSQLKCNRALCNVALQEALNGCRNSMTPKDCQEYTAVILASPFCSLLVIGGLTPIPFPGQD